MTCSLADLRYAARPSNLSSSSDSAHERLRDFYADTAAAGDAVLRAAPGREADPVSTALLVVDMLNHFVDGTLANPASGRPPRRSPG